MVFFCCKHTGSRTQSGDRISDNRHLVGVFSSNNMAIAMSANLKKAVADKIGCIMVNIPLELQMGMPSTCTWDEFPIKPIASSGTTHFTMALSRQDPVVNLRPDALPDLLLKFQAGNIIGAGPVMGMSADVPINDYQVAVLKKSETEHTIYKMVSFQGRTHRSRVEAAIGPEVYVVDMNFIPALNRLHPILQRMFEALGGDQLRSRQVRINPSARAVKKVKPDAEREAGFEFIREHGPRSNNQNQFIEWTEKYTSAPESPIHGWDKALVRQSLSNYAAGAATAPDTDSNSYPLTLVDFKPWILQEVAVPCLGSCAEKGIFLQGLSGVGKTPLATCMGIAISGHFLNEAEREGVLPTIRSAQHIDNFRAEAGTKYKPVIYDDGNFSSNSAADVKSFIDASTAVIIWARWGGVKLAANQARIMCANPINKDADREDLPFFTHGLTRQLCQHHRRGLGSNNAARGSDGHPEEVHLRCLRSSSGIHQAG